MEQKTTLLPCLIVGGCYVFNLIYFFIYLILI